MAQSDTDLLTKSEVLDRMRWSATTLRRRVLDGSFPQPIIIGGSRRWLKSDVDATIEAAVASRLACDPP